MATKTQEKNHNSHPQRTEQSPISPLSKKELKNPSPLPTPIELEKNAWIPPVFLDGATADARSRVPLPAGAKVRKPD